MLLMQRPLRVVSGLKSRALALKAKDVALRPPRVAAIKVFQEPHSDHPAACGTHSLASAAQAIRHKKEVQLGLDVLG